MVTLQSDYELRDWESAPLQGIFGVENFQDRSLGCGATFSKSFNPSFPLILRCFFSQAYTQIHWNNNINKHYLKIMSDIYIYITSITNSNCLRYLISLNVHLLMEKTVFSQIHLFLTNFDIKVVVRDCSTLGGQVVCSVQYRGSRADCILWLVYLHPQLWDPLWSLLSNRINNLGCF